ncbi:uncharacterized protein STEHIDRAFT_151222 [Stereum hirsutum FP-91666 SS1]|uniref:uncharacterized protein n=1 Tax=Stereum hirsutum (strain FP-91666) TaxID=721885 RepID=UPI000440C3EC|nr:uncharacterized protein STEHIDRAFT_151222 [Stereum hirsutum FP-91666 SS1]EIM91865.1 hypothetical protein STEHIDRAFT_151222 [Stereum hirsutum FP-91666 SS1]
MVKDHSTNGNLFATLAMTDGRSVSYCMNTVHEVLVNRGFWVLISRVDDPFVLSQEYLWGGLFTALVALPTQLFFAYRVWQFSGNKWIFPAIFVPCSLFQFAGYIAFIALCLNGGPTAQIIFAIEKLPMAFWGVSAAEDMLISLALMWFIWRKRAGVGFDR